MVLDIILDIVEGVTLVKSGKFYLLERAFKTIVDQQFHSVKLTRC